MKTIKLLQELSVLDHKRSILIQKIAKMRAREDKKRFNCSCVRLNADLGIEDMAEQHAAGRNGLGLGYVSETLSALASCAICGGTGRHVG
jgi:hypothetical protein